MKNIFSYLLFFTFLFISCSDKQHFKVEGNIKDAQGEMLYLEELHLDRIQPIDSIKMKKSGRFSFKVQRPIYPNFFRLRIKNRTIVFAVDSTETIQISAEANCFCYDYQIKGSESLKKIRALRLSGNKLEKLIENYDKNYHTAKKEIQEKKYEELTKAIEKHKYLARKLIFENPRSTASYYAVFQKLNSFQVFDPNNDEDLKCYAVVANAYSSFYPHSIRGKHLTNLVLQSKRAKCSQELKEILLEKSKGFVDISLPNINGSEILLSSLKGKVILLDFCYFKSGNILEHVFSLRDIYGKYNKRGFDIYSVSFDSDIDFWKSATKHLPWVCVYDEYAVNSDLLTMYDVDQLPTLFLIDKQGHIVSRYNTIDKQLDDSIDQLLDN